MRAKEFLLENGQQGVTISIPITITIPAGGGMPTIGTIAAPAGTVMPTEPVYVGPLQQELELLKQQGGKESKVINQILANNGAASPVADEAKESAEKAEKNYYNLSEDYDDLEAEYDSLKENANTFAEGS